MPPEVNEYRNKLEEYFRSGELKEIISTVDKISNGGTDMTLTCGIGVIRKKTTSGIINYPLLEIDLCCRSTDSGWSFAPECIPDPEIRLCPSLHKLEESKDTEDHTLQKRAQKILNQFAKSQRLLAELEMLKEVENRDDSMEERIQRCESRVKKRKPGPPVNPFDLSTYVSLLRKLGKLDPQFKDLQNPHSQEYELLSDASAKEQIQIFDMWVLFQSGGKDATKGVFRDAKRFLRTLNPTESIPQLWKPIALDVTIESSHGASLSSFQEQDVLLPLESSTEQVAILKSLESNDCVVVRGPPGTGKSHTIGE